MELVVLNIRGDTCLKLYKKRRKRGHLFEIVHIENYNKIRVQTIGRIFLMSDQKRESNIN